jgi:membrane protein
MEYVMARGRHAVRPREIPATGWKDIALRILGETQRDHIGLIAAGVAFYGLLALFPAITACMAIAGLMTEPASVVEQLDEFAAPLPDEAEAIIVGQATAVAGSETGGLGLAVVLGILIAIWSASRGMASLIEGMNIAYDETDERGFIKGALLNYGLTLFLIFGFLFGMTVVTIFPALLSALALGPAAAWIARVASWVTLLLLTMFGLAVLYRYGPDRERAKWRWITPGAALATMLWLIGSVTFAFYVSNFASYNETFGTLGGVVVLLMWLWLSAYAILLGAEIDSEIEAQTAVDSTTGPSKPMGERGAVKADVIGQSGS